MPDSSLGATPIFMLQSNSTEIFLWSHRGCFYLTLRVYLSSSSLRRGTSTWRQWGAHSVRNWHYRFRLLSICYRENWDTICNWLQGLKIVRTYSVWPISLFSISSHSQKHSHLTPECSGNFYGDRKNTQKSPAINSKQNLIKSKQTP